MKLKILQVKEAAGEKIDSSAIVYEMLTEESKADRECFWVLHLNTKNKVIEKELVSMGSVSQAIVHPREVFKKAIVNGAASIVLAHNHPSGDPSPSAEDIELTKRLFKAGEIIGINVIDHIILAPGSYFSFLTEGII